MQTSTLHNLPDAALVDELGALTDQLHELREREKAIKAELRRRGIDRCAGEKFVMWIVRDVAWLLDLDAVRMELGDDWCSSHSRIQGRTRVCTKALPNETGA